MSNDYLTPSQRLLVQLDGVSYEQLNRTQPEIILTLQAYLDESNPPTPEDLERLVVRHSPQMWPMAQSIKQAYRYMLSEKP